MLVYRISKCKYIEDLSGLGAATYPGRWNGKGTYILYTAATASLALLESVVHISNIPTIPYCMIGIEIPDNELAEVSVKDLPAGWQNNPPAEDLKEIGNQFVKEGKYLALKIPSALMPEEFNIILNPSHPDFKKVKIISKRNLSIDERLLKR